MVVLDAVVVCLCLGDVVVQLVLGVCQHGSLGSSLGCGQCRQCIVDFLLRSVALFLHGLGIVDGSLQCGSSLGVVILDAVVVGLGLADGGVQRALVGHDSKVGSSRATVVASTCDGYGGGACLHVVRVGHGVVGVQNERGLAVLHGDSRCNCTARIGLVGDGLNPCVLQVLRISHHYPYVGLGHGELPRAVLLLRHVDVAHQTGVIASTCEDFRSCLP